MRNKALERWRRNGREGSLRRALIREIRIMLYEDREYQDSVLHGPTTQSEGQ